MKLLEGYVKNRTKEVALATMLLALFFVARTFTIRLIPGILTLDFAGSVVFAAASMLSWPYTILFPLATVYGGSNLYVIICWLAGTQTVFFLSKLVGKKWAAQTPVFGEFVAFPVYGLTLHALGMMDFRTFIAVWSGPQIICIISGYIGGLIIWKAVRMFKVVD